MVNTILQICYGLMIFNAGWIVAWLLKDLSRRTNMSNEKTLIERLVEAGYPVDDIHHHYTDLYVYQNEITDRVLDCWLKEKGRSGLKDEDFFVERFNSNIDGKPMYDIAFQYERSVVDGLRKKN